MFKYLTEEWWKEFFKTIITNTEEKLIHDGQKFESLIAILLKEMYKSQDIVWKATKTTHDGSKDFCAYDLHDNCLPLWAECKNYAKKIELKTIAPTIVMVEINDISQILFFSYSPINNNTKEKLVLYAKKAGRSVYFYDDANLEKLILEHRNEVTKTYFKDYPFISQMDIDQTPYIFSKCGRGINISSEETPNANVLDVRLNDIIYIGIGVVNNQHLHNLSITISFKKLNDISHLEYLNDKIEKDTIAELNESIDIRPSSAIFYPLFFRVAIYKKSITLPQITVRYQSPVLDDIAEITTPEISCSNLYVTALMGSQYRKLVNEFRKNYINSGRLGLCILEGKSGVGKTRMLHEFIGVLMESHYQIVDFTGMNGEASSLQVIKEIIYNLYNLSEELIIESLKEPQQYEETFGDDTIQILQILQNLTKCESTAFLEIHKEFVFEKILVSRVGILIDNIQYFDDILINFLRDLCIYAKNVNRESRAVLVLTHNTDYKSSDTLTAFYSSLLFLKDCLHILTKKYLIDGFVCTETEQALGYLKAIVAVKDDSMNPLLNKIVSITDGNPKYILEVVEYLEIKNVLSFQNGLLVITNHKAFNEELKSLPTDINSLIGIRWNLIEKELTEQADNAYILLSAVHFWRRCNEDIIEKLLLDFNLTSLLERRGILKKDSYDGSCYYKFEHDLIEHYFNKNNKFCFLIINYIIEHDLIDELSPDLDNWQYSLIKLKSNHLDESFLIDSLQQIMNRQLEISFKWGLIYFKNLIDYIIKNFKNCTHKDIIINACSAMCLKIKNIYGTALALEQYCSIYKFMERTLGPERYLNRNYLEFINGYTENLLHMGSNEVISIYDIQISLLKFHSKQFPDILGMLYNRKYVYYKNKRPEAEVHKYFHYCKKICKKYNLRELEMLNYFDAGNYYLYTENQIDNLINNWEIGLDIYYKERFKDAFLYISKKQIQFCLIKKDYETVNETLEAVQRYLKECKKEYEQTLFFYKSFGILGSIYYLLAEPEEVDLWEYLSQALEYNLQINGDKLFNLYFLYAKMYYKKECYNEMVLYFEKSLQNLDFQSDLYCKNYLMQIILEDFEYKLSCIRLRKQSMEYEYFQQKKTLNLWKRIEEKSFDSLLDYERSFKTRANVSSKDGKDGYLLL